MFLTILDTVLDTLAASAAAGVTAGVLAGTVRDGDVYQAESTTAAAGRQLIGRWRSADIAEPPRAAVDNELLVLFQPDTREIQPLWCDANGSVAVPYTIVRLHADYHARLRGVFEVDTLATRSVAVIGLGTGGSRVALELAKVGIGHLRLVDHDRLEVHNIARHVCGMRDVGRYKTRALRDLLRDASPLVQVDCWEANILEQPSAMADAIRGCDLVVAATDGERSKSAINAACWPANIPAVYGAAYNRAFGGDVVLIAPGETGCYECFLSQATELFNTEQSRTLPTDLPYEDPQRLADAVAEPGLGLDVAIIALIHAKMALLTLLRGTASTLEPLPSHWVLWGNRREWVFEKPLESIFMEDVPRRPDCPYCNRAGWVMEHLGLTDAELRDHAAALLAQAQSISGPVDDLTGLSATSARHTQRVTVMDGGSVDGGNSRGEQ